MKRELYMADLYPKVVAAHQKSALTLKMIDSSCHFEEGEFYKIEVLPLNEPVEDGSQYDSSEVRATDNELQFTYLFGNEQEYFIRVFKNDGNMLIQMSCYALEPDLFGTIPYRGDLHIHTCGSDGQESPEFVAAEYRKAGFDFMAVTDHFTMKPSLDVIDYYKNVPIDLKLFPGEEVHLGGNHIHIVNFGGNFSINQLFRDHPDGYRREVEALSKTLDCPPGVSAFEYASCLWIYQKIREGGGLAIFAHPHWLQNVNHVRDTMTWHQFRKNEFDAFELLGGQSSEENNRQIAIYNQARSEGLDFPIVGSSDSHSVLNGQYFTEMQTIVFAKSSEKSSLISSIKAGNSTAVESYHGEHYKVHGSYRLSCYSLFLLREYFPVHDALCEMEGQAMHLYVQSGRKDSRALSLLELMHGQISELQKRYFFASI